jgi:hypothetical protein
MPDGMGGRGKDKETMKTKFMNTAATALSALALFATTDARAGTVDLSTKTTGYITQNDGDVLTGTMTDYGVYISNGHTVTFSNVVISCDSYCVQCGGSATIILADGTENTLTVTGDKYSAICIGGGGTTLTIKGEAAGTGVLNATGTEGCAAIGGGFRAPDGGNIVIEGGVITAQGGERGAGIGGGRDSICGDITILGGTVTATGGAYGAGIGSGGKGNGNNTPSGCGDIIISGGTVTATGGKGAAGIGSGGKNWQNGTMTRAVYCGDITISKTVTKVTAKRGADGYYPNLTLIPAFIGAGIAEDPKGNVPTCGTVSIAPELTDTTIGGTRILEGAAPVLSGYAAWAADNGVTGAWNEKSDGVYNVFRYAFDVPSGTAGTQITNIVVEGNTAVVLTPAMKHSEGVTVSVVESSDVAGASVSATKPLDATGTNTFTVGTATSRFYRLSATLTE